MTKHIVGIREDDLALTYAAEQRCSVCVDGEWIDTHFEQTFDLDPAVIGPDVLREQVVAETSGGWWDGVARVLYVESESGSPVAVRDARVAWAVCCAIARDGYARPLSVVELSGVPADQLAPAIVAMELAGQVVRVRRDGGLAWVRAE